MLVSVYVSSCDIHHLSNNYQIFADYEIKNMAI